MATDKKIRLKVASPCHERWEDMQGDDAVRFCGKCEKNVYQLSNMTAAAIEELLNRPGERVCTRFYQRADGTVLTADCPVGATRRRRKKIALGVGAGLMSAVAAAMWPGAVQPTMGKLAMPPQVETHPAAPGHAHEPGMEPAVHEDLPVMMGEVAPVPVMGRVAPSRAHETDSNGADGE